jgi:ferredoxin
VRYREAGMASIEFRYPENSPGAFFVDHSCIACDTCVGIASPHFELTQNNDHAFVKVQPQTKSEWDRCKQAVHKCPVQAIGILEITS